ncbi:MAG: ParB/RepB/Spo0J family partition protein [Ruminococcaceae bacterium]|nr:ParB/RepB/Spo0J family partition protein [Oscillospiraceae bacterium]
MARKPGGLGRDFYEIYNDNNPEKGSNQTIRIADIEPRRDQPRKQFDREALETLADSIATYGVLQPIIVRENASIPGVYEIIAGERRWRASKMAGLTEIPAIVFDGDELKAAQVALIENIQREDLNPVEEAFAYGALIERYGLTQDQVAKQVGKSRPAVANTLRLLELPDEVLDMLKNGELSAGHARALLGLNSEDDVVFLAKRIVERDMSVREVEAAVRRLRERAEAEEEEAETEAMHPQVKAHMKELERRAMSALGRKVRISRSTKKKIVELSYDDDSDLEALLIALCGNTIFNETENDR